MASYGPGLADTSGAGERLVAAMFVDEVQICVRGGDGGDGCISFHREKFRPRGGPDGGGGGRGGDVFVVADPNISTLSRFRRRVHWKAAPGAHGSGNNRRGRSGPNLSVPVPVGTLVKDREGVVLADLANPGDRAKVASGGVGGRGNASFATPTRRSPNFAERGEPGEERWLRLELKVVADVGLVGMPNAGKSTLLRRISAARPKVGDYPFTTLSPHLGVVDVDGFEFVVADLPGLIEGASEGRGLGDRFLRHVERCRVLVLLLDLAAGMGIAPEEQERILAADLEAYSPSLLEKTRLVVANKVDLARGAFEELSRRRPEIAGVSAKTGEGVAHLLRRVAAEVQASRAREPRRKSYLLYRPRPGGFLIEGGDGYFVVVGEVAWRLSRIKPSDSRDALGYIRSKLRREGVERALVAAGIRAGDTVRLGDVEFEWRPDSEGDRSGPGSLGVETVGSVRRRRR